jgi:antibiotic biosynthesis monooxygenase (ABM) superfamily enzyme
MDESHDQTDFGTQISFLGSGPILAFLTLKVYIFLNNTKILMSLMTYFFFKPLKLF